MNRQGLVALTVAVGVTLGLAVVDAGAQPTRPKAVGGVADLKEPGDEAIVGKNATGEQCRLRLFRKAAADDRMALQVYRLYCEGWEAPSGHILRFRVLPHATGQRLVTESTWQKSWADRLDCREAEAAPFQDGMAASLRECRRVDGGWPVVVMAGVTQKFLGYAFETFPTNVALMEAAYEILEGKRAAAATGGGTQSAAIKRAEAIVGAGGKLIAVKDIDGAEKLRELARFYSNSGDFGSAELTWRRLLEMHERLLGLSSQGAATIVGQIAYTLSLQARFPEADDWFTRAEPLARASAGKDDLPLFVTHRAFNEAFRLKNDEALRLAEEAGQLSGQRRGMDSGVYAYTLVPLSYALRGLKRYDEAIEATKRAIRIFETPGPAPEWRQHWAAEQTYFLGLIYRDQKRFPEARAALTEALRRRERSFGESANVFQVLMALGITERRADDIPAALGYYRRAASIMAKSDAAQRRPRAGTVAAYVDTLVAAAQATPAERDALGAETLVAAQRPIDGDVAKALRLMSVRVAAGDPKLATATRERQDAEERRKRVEAALRREQDLPADQRDPAREEALKAQHRQADEAVERTDARLQGEFPRYVSLTSEKPLSLDELKAVLRPGEALITFVSGIEATFVVLVRDGRVDVHRGPLGARALKESVQRLRETLEPGADGRPKPFDVEASHRLYTALLGPLAPRLAGATNLIAVPSGPLLSLPLGVLVTKPVAAPADGDYTKVPWLAREVPISVVPSIAALRSLRAVAVRSAAPKPFVGFGDPDFQGGAGDTRSVAALGDFCRQGETIDIDLLRALPRLRESAGELRQIATALGAGADAVLTGAQATEKKVRETDLAQFRVVAFATHGLLPGELKCQAQPGLALTPPATSAPGDNGLLDAEEVAVLRLDADWVLLSACNTAGAGGALGGESLSGLARAFIFAGTRAILVSHWAVASRPTVALTTGTFDAWAKTPAAGKGAALARAQAQLAAARDTSHPFFWAPFVLVGDR